MTDPELTFDELKASQQTPALIHAAEQAEANATHIMQHALRAHLAGNRQDWTGLYEETAKAERVMRELDHQHLVHVGQVLSARLAQMLVVLEQEAPGVLDILEGK